jgi:hypothetical protein
MLQILLRERGNEVAVSILIFNNLTDNLLTNKLTFSKAKMCPNNMKRNHNFTEGIWLD